MIFYNDLRICLLNAYYYYYLIANAILIIYIYIVSFQLKNIIKNKK